MRSSSLIPKGTIQTQLAHHALSDFLGTSWCHSPYLNRFKTDGSLVPSLRLDLIPLANHPPLFGAGHPDLCRRKKSNRTFPGRQVHSPSLPSISAHKRGAAWDECPYLFFSLSHRESRRLIPIAPINIPRSRCSPKALFSLSSLLYPSEVVVGVVVVTKSPSVCASEKVSIERGIDAYVDE